MRRTIVLFISLQKCDNPPIFKNVKSLEDIHKYKYRCRPVGGNGSSVGKSKPLNLKQSDLLTLAKK